MKSNSVKVIVAALLFAGAGFGFYRSYHNKSPISEQAYFYDLSEKKLFAVSREELPPIKGLNDDKEDAVRAVVISLSGHPEDPASHSIAYLEKYAPELKQNLAQIREGKAEPMPS